MTVRGTLGFVEEYCTRKQIARGDFREVLLRQAFYPHARFLRPLINLMSPEFFRADCDYVLDIERIRRKQDLDRYARDFHAHPRNRGRWRRIAKLRVSTRRMNNEVLTHLPQEPDLVPPSVVG